MAGVKKANRGRICKIKDCGLPHRARGYCQKHWKAARRNGEFEDLSANDTECKIDGCHNRAMAHGLCNRHYQHVYHYGYVKPRTKTDPNTFDIEGDICRIGLFNNDGLKVAETIIDAEDYVLVKGRKWYSRPDGRGTPYVVSGYGETYIRLHRLLTGAKEGQLVDHENHDTLDNRRSTNLRICNNSQNGQNALVKGKRNSSGTKNVTWNNEHKKWAVEVQSDGVKYYMGRFDSLEDAQRAAQAARDRYHGNFACNR